jgi:hypothetical protein
MKVAGRRLAGALGGKGRTLESELLLVWTDGELELELKFADLSTWYGVTPGLGIPDPVASLNPAWSRTNTGAIGRPENTTAPSNSPTAIGLS